MTKNKTNNYRIGRSNAGLGLFAERNFKKDEFVIEYKGDKLTHEQADEVGGRYLFILNENVVLDGKKRKYTARYINHSCNPNMEAIIEDDAHIMFYTLRKIKKDEEFTFDYGEEYVQDIIKKQGCKCKKCFKD